MFTAPLQTFLQVFFIEQAAFYSCTLENLFYICKKNPSAVVLSMRETSIISICFALMFILVLIFTVNIVFSCSRDPR